MRQPIQPLMLDERGVLRFRSNAIVRYLLDNGGIDLNHLACVEFPQEDREQFAQLIGYSLSGFGELSYISDDTYDTAKTMSSLQLTEEQARSMTYHDTLSDVRSKMRELVPLLFQIHPDDLVE